MKKLNRTVPWLSNFMKATLTNNNQELPLDLSQYATEAHVPKPGTTEDITKKVMYKSMFFHQLILYTQQKVMGMRKIYIFRIC